MSDATATRKQIANYAVSFIVNRKRWTERINRPIGSEAIVAAVIRSGATRSVNLDAPYVYDWAGRIYAGMRPIGTYVIDPASGE